MRILFTGAAPWVNSGYGKPYRYLIPRLAAAGHDIALACFHGWNGAVSDTNIGGGKVRLYPPAKAGYFNDIIEHDVDSFDADLVISLQDVWVLDGWGQKGFPWCPRFPIDTHPVSKAILEAIGGCHTPLALTRWGQEELFNAGWPQAGYLPHGIDTGIYHPQDQQAAREATGLPDGFLVGMVAANSSNPSRKSFPEVLQAWSAWLQDGNAGVLYLHTTVSPKQQYGMNFEHLLETLGLTWAVLDDPDADRITEAQVLFPSQYRMWRGAVDDAELAQIYNALDVYLAPSMAEGFGIPIVEAQACGVPVVTLAVTSMPELTWAGKCLQPEQLAWESQGGWRGVAPVKALEDALDWAARLDNEERLALREEGVSHAREFDFDRLIDLRWLPLLERLELTL